MGFFDSRYKFRVHMLQICIVVGAIGVSVARLLIKTNVTVASARSRANTMALGVGAKSLIIIAYEVLTEHSPRFKRWASLKANMILNVLETVFWGAVVFLVAQANIQNSCTGIRCTLSWVVAALGIILNILASYTAVVSILDFRYFKRTGVPRGTELTSKSERIEEGGL